MITEKWHDLRKDPNDLPETRDNVWVILAENPKEVEVDAYDPDDKGKERVIHTRTTTEKYIASGWWQFDHPSQQVTHWMYIETPEPPTE